MTLNIKNCVLLFEKILKFSLYSKKFMYILIIISIMNGLIKPSNSYKTNMKKISQINYRDQFEHVIY